MNFFEIIGAVNIRALRRNVPNRYSNSRITRNKIATRRTRQVVAHAHVLNFITIVQHRTRDRLIGVCTPRGIFRLKISKYTIITIFNVLLEQTHPVHLHIHYELLVANTDKQLPGNLLVHSQPNQVTVRVTVLKVDLKASASRVTTTRVLRDTWHLTRRLFSNQILLNGHLFRASKVSIRERLVRNLANTRTRHHRRRTSTRIMKNTRQYTLSTTRHSPHTPFNIVSTVQRRQHTHHNRTSNRFPQVRSKAGLSVGPVQ